MTIEQKGPKTSVRSSFNHFYIKNFQGMTLLIIFANMYVICISVKLFIICIYLHRQKGQLDHNQVFEG